MDTGQGGLGKGVPRCERRVTGGALSWAGKRGQNIMDQTSIFKPKRGLFLGVSRSQEFIPL